MIRINLLPEEYRKKARTPVKLLLSVAGAVTLNAGLLAWWGWAAFGVQSEIESEKAVLAAEDFFEQRDDRVVRGDFSGAAQALAERTAFVNDDAPFPVIFMGGRFVRRSADVQQISAAMVAEAQIPAPVFLAGRVGF